MCVCGGGGGWGILVHWKSECNKEYSVKNCLHSNLTLLDGLDVDLANLFEGQFRLVTFNFPDRDILFMNYTHIAESIIYILAPMYGFYTSTEKTQQSS